MHPYDATGFEPPAPFAHVTVISDALGTRVDHVPVLLDTGADVSLLPRAHVASLVPPDAQQYQLEAFDGTKSTAPAIDVKVLFLGKTLRGQFLLIDGWHGVLGRNVLNNLRLLFDGPAKGWEELPK